MNISAIDPITPAWNHMVRILFKPFEFKKWMLLGFCAFLAQCGEGAGSGNGSNWSNSSNRQDFDFDTAKQWVESNMGLVVGIVIGSFTLLIVIALLVNWLSSRGKFMLLDDGGNTELRMVFLYALMTVVHKSRHCSSFNATRGDRFILCQFRNCLARSQSLRTRYKELVGDVLF